MLKELIAFAARVAIFIVMIVIAVNAVNFFTGGSLERTLNNGFARSDLNGGPLGAPHQLTTPLPAEGPTCDEGAKYVAELGKCIYTMTDPVEVQKYSPDQASVPEKCKGKQPGHRYTEKVTDERGRVGTANKVCGRRPVAGVQ